MTSTAKSKKYASRHRPPRETNATFRGRTTSLLSGSRKNTDANATRSRGSRKNTTANVSRSYGFQKNTTANVSRSRGSRKNTAANASQSYGSRKNTAANASQSYGSRKNTAANVSRSHRSRKTFAVSAFRLNTSRPRKTASRRRLTQSERQRQLRFRIGLTAGVVLLFLLFLIRGSFPFGNGHAINLTDSVTQYKEQVEHYCEEYSIPAFSQVVLAIMQQESAGTVPDVMQASESPFNTWYSNTPNSITDPDYSIQVGVETFAYCLEEAGCTSPRDIEALKLALQTYNYGNSYATWALDNYGGYSPDNALEFSENMKLRLGWSRYGDPEYVSHVLQYYRSGF